MTSSSCILNCTPSNCKRVHLKVGRMKVPMPRPCGCNCAGRVALRGVLIDRSIPAGLGRSVGALCLWPRRCVSKYRSGPARPPGPENESGLNRPFRPTCACRAPRCGAPAPASPVLPAAAVFQYIRGFPFYRPRAKALRGGSVGRGRLTHPAVPPAFQDR